MRHLWKEPVKLPRFWRYLLGILQIGGPVAITLIGIHARRPGESQNLDLWLTVSIWIAGSWSFAVLIKKTIEIAGTPRKRVVDCLLEQLGTELWQRTPDKLQGPRHQHRITLFQLKRRTWIGRKLQRRWTHTLVPRTRVPRSGRRPRRVFRVHDHYRENCEGVAGLVFASEVIVTPQLPDLHADARVSDEEYQEYARLTNDELRTVKKDPYYSRIIGGVNIYAAGERWGMLIMDSRDPDAITTKTLSGASAKRVLRVLSSLFGEGSS